MPRDFHKEARAGRSRELTFLVGAVVLVLAWRLFDLQVIHGSYYRHRSEDNRIRVERLDADRGRILDRRGRVLAENYPSSRLTLDPHLNVYKSHPEQLQLVVDSLAVVLGVKREDLWKQVETHQARSRRPVVLTRALQFEQVSRIEERLERLAGVRIEAVSIRRYPEGDLACHVLGYLGEVTVQDLEESADGHYEAGDLIGKTGIEKQYEAVLRGIDGEAYVEVNARGRHTTFFPPMTSRPSTAGHDLVLTLDVELQAAAEQALQSTRPHGGRGGHENDPAPSSSLVALDPRSGEILAMVSYPGFDPNIFVGGLSPEEYRTLQMPTKPQQDRAIQSAYPPGSTFKIVTSLASLEADLIRPDIRMEPCLGSYKYGNRAFRCWKRTGHGRLEHAGALRQSCDVFYYQLGAELGVRRLAEYARNSLHLHERTGIDLPGERSPLIPTPAWYEERMGGYRGGVALNLSIGQGELLLTPIALARLYAAIANDGHWVQPHLLKNAVPGEGKTQRLLAGELSPDAWQRREAFTSEFDRLATPTWASGQFDLDGADLAEVKSALEEVVMNARGTGIRARVGEIRIAGKTGTSENRGEDHALFACYAPAEDPTIVIVVVAEEAGHGGAVAAPVAQKVLEEYFSRAVDDGSTAGNLLEVAP